MTTRYRFGMTVKSAVAFIDEHHAFAKAAVEQGERRAMLDAMSEEIRRRAETPDDRFVEHVPGDFARILERMLADRAQHRGIPG